MRYLVDTHALIWFVNGDNQLSGFVKKEIKDRANSCYVSIAAIWEIAIKINTGRLEMNIDFNRLGDFLAANEMTLLPVEYDHLLPLTSLELFHRDPFDRVMIVQAITDDLTILTSDAQFNKYPVKCLW